MSLSFEEQQINLVQENIEVMSLSFEEQQNLVQENIEVMSLRSEEQQNLVQENIEVMSLRFEEHQNLLAQLVAEGKEMASIVVDNYYCIMEEEIPSIFSSLNKKWRRGYTLKVLFAALRKLYCELRESLKSNEKIPESLTEWAQEVFTRACEKLQRSAVEEYILAVDTALKSTLDSAVFEVASKVEELLQDDDYERASCALKNYLRLMEAKKIRDVSGWCFDEKVYGKHFKEVIWGEALKRFQGDEDNIPEWCFDGNAYMKHIKEVISGEALKRCQGEADSVDHGESVHTSQLDALAGQAMRVPACESGHASQFQADSVDHGEASNYRLAIEE